MAIIWKNFVAVSRAVRVPLIVGPMLAGAVALAVVSAARPGGTTLTHFAGVLLTSWGALLVAAGPLWIRYDLRQDLPKIELLRAFPLSGSAIVGAEIAASTVILSAFQLALFTLAWLAFLRDPSLELAPRARTALLCAALLVLPAVNALALAIQNAAALFFPGWVRLGANRGGGVEAMGLGLITMLASALVLAVLLVVPMLLGAGAGYALRGWLGLWAVAPALAAAVLGVGGELLLLVRWLGRVFERTDPSMVAAQE